MHWTRSILTFLGAALVCFAKIARGNELETLQAQADLTPESLIRSISSFTFELNAEPQAPEQFLKRRRGDCDDFASLAQDLLTARGFTAKLVVVMMKQQTHVVCYVKEAHGYLDFNHRADQHPIVESDGSLEDIADKVSMDFRNSWNMASEFKYQRKAPVYLQVVFPSANSPRFAANTDSGSPATGSTNSLISAASPASATSLPTRQGN